MHCNFFLPFVLSLLFHLSFIRMSLPPPWYLSTWKDLCIYLFLVFLFLVHICSCFDLDSLSSGASFFYVFLLPDLLTAVRCLLSSRSIIFLLVANAWTPSLEREVALQEAPAQLCHLLHSTPYFQTLLVWVSYKGCNLLSIFSLHSLYIFLIS